MPPSRPALPVRRTSKVKTNALNQSAREAAKAMAACQRLIKASLCRVRFACGKPSCRCAKDIRCRHAALTFTYKRKGRSMGLHVPKAMEREARQAVADYAKLKQLVETLSRNNLERFRLKTQAMKRRAFRP